MHQRPRYRDALLLSPGQLRRAMLPPVGQAHRRQTLLHPFLGVGFAAQQERERDVLTRGQPRQQVEELEELFPLPLGPMMARNSPLATSNETPCTAWMIEAPR